MCVCVCVYVRVGLRKHHSEVYGRRLYLVREFDSEDSVECVVCDETSTLTGRYNGLIAIAKREMNKDT